MELCETNALNLKQFFYKEIRSVVETKEIRALKLLIATSLNVHRLFLKRLLMAIIIAYERFEVVELLVKEYGATLESYSIHAIIWERKLWQYLLELDVDLNKKRQEQTSFMFAMTNESNYLVEELANTIDIDINEEDNKFKISLKRIA